MDFKIREIDTGKEKDLWAVANLEHNLREEIGGKNTVQLEKAVDETQHEFEDISSFMGRRDIILAEVGGKAVGYITYSSSDFGLEIETFYVTPCFRKHGIGTAMIKQLLERAGSSGLNYIKVVAPLAESRKMYERLGFKPYPRFGEAGMLLHIDA